MKNQIERFHQIFFANCMNMNELEDQSVQLIVTSPPYYNAPFDYDGLFKTYDSYLNMLNEFSKEAYRVLEDGRIFVLNIDDMLVDGVKYPIVADATKIMQNAGFRYRDRIIWKKPDGYLRISKRSGVLLQNPYPMYFYPDNLLESIIIFQKGKFDYKKKSKSQRQDSLIDIKEFNENKWNRTLWEFTNVLPGSKLEKNVAAFPGELPYRVIKLFSYVGETVLDPFLGSGTTMKVADQLKRNCVGYEILKDLKDVIVKKTGLDSSLKSVDRSKKFDIIYRNKGKYRCLSLNDFEKRRNQKGN